MGWLVVPVPFPCCRLSRIAGACEQEGPAFFVTAVSSIVSDATGFFRHAENPVDKSLGNQVVLGVRGFEKPDL